jgi:AraC family transcriptional regulator, transcriptional activator of pobA
VAFLLTSVCRQTAAMTNQSPSKTGYFLMDTLENPADQRTRTGMTPYYQIWWIKKGSGSICINGERHPIIDNTIYCLPPGKITEFRSPGYLTGYYLFLSGDCFHADIALSRDVHWINTFILEMNQVILSGVADLQEEMDPLFKNLQKECSKCGLLREETVAGLLNLIAIYFSRKMTSYVREPVLSRDFILVQRFKGMVKTNFVSQKLVGEYARDLHITASYLNGTVKRVTGFTASHYIQHCVIREAKRLAIQSDLSMKETAYTLGFADQYHFSRYFKMICGMTFSGFKHITSKSC